MTYARVKADELSNENALNSLGMELDMKISDQHACNNA